jgi:hypothetical protein
MNVLVDDNYIFSENTLDVSCITKDKYLAILNIDKNDIKVLQQMIKTRNLVHLNKVVIDIFNKEKVDFIYSFYDMLKQKEEDKRKICNRYK